MNQLLQKKWATVFMFAAISSWANTAWIGCANNLAQGWMVLAHAPMQGAQLEAPPCQNSTTSVVFNGVKDQFGQPGEATYQGSGIQSIGNGPWANFDYLAPDRQFGHTVTGLPCNITAATLTLRIKSTSSLSRNDNIGLGITGGTPRFLWARRVKDVIGQPWNQSGSTATMTLDLANLPGANGINVDILHLLNASGELDIYMQDDTAVDYVQLDLVSCLGSDCNNNGITDSCEDLPLILNCPDPITKTLPPTTEKCCLEFNITPYATDVCGNPEQIEITNDYNNATGSFSACFPTGTTTIVFTATDKRGNELSCSTTVTVLDKTPPTILFCPEQ